MSQHPIPQQISSYEFKLVGDMTLKQFLKLAAGVGLALIINSSKILPIFKWPLMIVSGGAGLLLAFVPFQDKPLEAWVGVFLKAIYAPTIYTYQRRGSKNWLDLDLTKNTKTNTSANVNESEEDIVIGKISSNAMGSKLRDKVNTIGIKSKKTEENKEEVVEKVEEVKNETTTVAQKVAPAENKIEEKVIPQKVDDWRDKKANLNLKTEKLAATGRAVFGSIPMPDIPETPNVVVGMATDVGGKIVDGVIIEIQDEHGNPSRVLKSNSLGQFKTTTPLANGRYLIIAEKDGYNFDRVNIDLNGQIVQPVRIIANN